MNIIRMRGFTKPQEVIVDLTVMELWKELNNFLHQKLIEEFRNKREDCGETMYIKDGRWESWEKYPHGSGTTYSYRQATPEEIKVFESLPLLKEMIAKAESNG